MKIFLINVCFFSLLSVHANWHGCFSSFNALFSIIEKSQLPQNSSDINKLNNLEDLDLYLANKDFLSVQNLGSLKEINNHNSAVKRLLKNEAILDHSVDSNGVSLRGSVTREQAQTLYEDMVNTPCVRNSGPYERTGVSLGYCFGRAIIASMHALKRSVHPGAMKKIWVAGEMSGNWGHHVAFMVRGDNGEWFVIDNVTGLVTHEEWIRVMENQYRLDKGLMFFVTGPERFGPEQSEAINNLNLFNLRNSDWSNYSRDDDYYKGFFKDFFEWFDDQDGVTTFQ
jgi:hypothetical protein